MAQPDLQTTAINDLAIQVQDNETLLTTLTNFTVNLLNDNLLDSLNKIVIEMKIMNKHLSIMTNEELIEIDMED